VTCPGASVKDHRGGAGTDPSDVDINAVNPDGRHGRS
jgi:hypothetical protein